MWTGKGKGHPPKAVSGKLIVSGTQQVAAKKAGQRWYSFKQHLESKIKCDFNLLSLSLNFRPR